MINNPDWNRANYILCLQTNQNPDAKQASPEGRDPNLAMKALFRNEKTRLVTILKLL